MGKFDPRSAEATFIVYSSNIKAYRVLVKDTGLIEESIHVNFDEANTFGENVLDYEDDFQIGLFNQSKELIDNSDVRTASKIQAESSDKHVSKPNSSNESNPVDSEEDLGQSSQVHPQTQGEHLQRILKVLRNHKLLVILEDLVEILLDPGSINTHIHQS